MVIIFPLFMPVYSNKDIEKSKLFPIFGLLGGGIHGNGKFKGSKPVIT